MLGNVATKGGDDTFDCNCAGKLTDEGIDETEGALLTEDFSGEILRKNTFLSISTFDKRSEGTLNRMFRHSAAAQAVECWANSPMPATLCQTPCPMS